METSICNVKGCKDAARPDRKTCVRHGQIDADQARKSTARRKAKGLCASSGCENKPKDGRTLCELHLIKLREGNKARSRERQASGLCVACGHKSELGQARCLLHRERLHRAKWHYALPQPVRKALREYRAQEQQAAKDSVARVKREFIERHLHLIRKERDKEILRRRYGYTEEESQALEEIGLALGITRERVRQVQQMAEEKIFMFTIEKDIPIPPPQGRDIGSEARSTLGAMNVGDSFVIQTNQRNNIQALAKRMGLLITTRRLENGQVRVWLVSKAEELQQEHAA